MLSIDEKLKAFKSSIKKEHGIVPGIEKVKKIESNIAPLDVMLDGGIPMGRFVEIYGAPNGGKSTLAMVIASQFQKIKPVLYLDVEATFGKEWARSNDLDISDDKFILYSAGSKNSVDNMSAEKVVDIVLKGTESEAFSLIIVDSVAAMVDEEKIAAGTGKSSLGSVARLLSGMLPIIKQKAVKTDTTVLFINQTRSNINVGYGGKATKSTGGNAMKFYGDLKMELYRAEQLKKGNEIVGHLIKLRVEKSKVSIPRRTCKFPIIYEFGISPELALFDSAVELGVIKRSGSFYGFGDIKLQGRENFLDELVKSREIFNKIKNDIYNKYVHVDKDKEKAEDLPGEEKKS